MNPLRLNCMQMDRDAKEFAAKQTSKRDAARQAGNAAEEAAGGGGVSTGGRAKGQGAAAQRTAAPAKSEEAVSKLNRGLYSAMMKQIVKPMFPNRPSLKKEGKVKIGFHTQASQVSPCARN